MLAEILPHAVATAEVYDDPTGVRLHPEESACVARAVEARRRVFATGRHCARAALGELDVEPAPIPRGASGEPVWPPGVVGSITHCEGFRAAAVARRADVAALGVDGEPNEPLPGGVLRTVSLPGERDRLPTRPGVAWDRLLFSAKESVYKAWFPLTGMWLDFLEVDVTIEPDTSTFSARLLVPGPVVDGVRWSALSGRFLVRDGLVVSAVSGGHG